jgi:hypothetical protein
MRKVLRFASQTAANRLLTSAVLLLSSTLGWAQPTVLAGRTQDGATYRTYALGTALSNVFAQAPRILATANSPAGSGADWAFTAGSAASPLYSFNWRPNVNSPQIPGYNQVIDPTVYSGSARYNNGGGQDGRLPAVTSGRYYTYNITLRNNSGNYNIDQFMAVLETAYNPVNITDVTRNPATPAYGQGVTVTATTDAAPDAAEYLYLRYSTDAFATSTVVPMTGSGATRTAAIPGQTNTTAVAYYVFSSPNAPSATGTAAVTPANADLLTLTLNNNNKANYSYATSPTLCGAYTINPTGGGLPNFTTFSAAFSALITNGIACGVTFTVKDGVTFSDQNLNLNAIAGASGSARVVFQRENLTGPAASRPKVQPVTAFGAGGTADAIIKLNGSDFITFDGIDVVENTANSAATGNNPAMEYGYALFRAAPTDGCQSNIIRNCAITLNKANGNLTYGIWSANTDLGGGAVTTTSTAGANSTNEFDGLTIANAFYGIYLNGTVVGFPDTDNKVGTTLGNSIANIGGKGSTNVHGIRCEIQNNLRIENNTVTIPTGSTGSSILRGISTGTTTPAGITGDLLITSNTITINTASTGTIRGIDQSGTSAIGNVSITTNRVLNSAVTGATGTVTWIEDASSNATTAQTVTITGNQVTGNATATSGVVNGIFRSGIRSSATTVSSNQVLNNVNSAASEFDGIQVAGASASATPITVSSNSVSGNQLTGAGGQLFCLSVNNGTITASSNTLTNNTIPNTTGTAVAEVNGYYSSGTGTVPSETVTDNTITGLGIGGGSTATTHAVRGLYFNGGATTGSLQTVLRNVVGALSIAGSGSGAVTGMVLAKGGKAGTSIARNKVYDLSAGGAGGTATGIAQTGGGTFTYANNLLGDFRAPAADAANAVVGLSLTGGNAANVYFNTVYLNAGSTGATFGTSGVLLGATTPVADLRNNVVANLSTPAGVGVTAALRRSGTNATNSNFAAVTNNNLYWAGSTPSPTNVLFTDGTATAQDLPAYKALLAPRETNSFTENPPFLSTDGTLADFLHLKTYYGTQIESGGQPIAGISDDYDGTARNATTPDLGADEGTFRLGPPLPVELSAFEAVRQGDAAALTWATATERNNRGFGVQVSTDGRTYRELAFVAGAGSSSAAHRYAYTDREANKAGLRYYRLRQTDADGTVSYSPVRPVAFAEGAVAGAAPQPFSSEFTLTLRAPLAQANVLLTLADATGRVVLSRRLDVPAGASQLPVGGLAALPAGLYVVQLVLAGQPVRLKVLKE